MLRLANIDNPRLAQAYIDYMACQGIEIKMFPDDDGKIALWLVNDNDQLDAQNELERFIHDPFHQRYAQASWQRAETKQQAIHYRSVNYWSLIKAKAGPLTLLIMLVCTVIFVANQVGWGQAIFNWVHFPAVETQKWQLWRWITPALFHFSVVHIVFNLLWWWQLGGDIEQRLGTHQLLLLFVLSSSISGIAQYWVDGPSFGGLSGVVYALLGYIWIVGWKRPDIGLSISKPILGFMLVWLMFGYIQPLMAIANTAHLAGLVSGMVLAMLEIRVLRKHKRA